jgi:argininosuccinate lyase
MNTHDSDQEPVLGWSGRFSEPVAELVKLYTASIDFDQRLADADITASIAHARMLGATGVLTPSDVASIERGMQQIRGEIERGELKWSRDLEDVHQNLERRLTELIGDAGKRLHTGRSRNDQIALDERLYVREVLGDLDSALATVQSALLEQAEKHREAAMPGYTHLQRAQPVLAAHYFLAYVEKYQRDRERLADCRRRVNVLPLGAAALAGTSLPIDRDSVRRQLGFDSLARNSLDVSSDRDFVLDIAVEGDIRDR